MSTNKHELKKGQLVKINNNRSMFHGAIGVVVERMEHVFDERRNWRNVSYNVYLQGLENNGLDPVRNFNSYHIIEIEKSFLKGD